jgi:arabinan endo-1,5-alpha-L-arabinosidase
MKRRSFLHRSLVSVAGAYLPSRLFAADATPAPTPAPATPTVPAAATATPADALARLYQLGRRNLGVHDPSTIVKCKDEYWLFRTGNGIPSARSKDLLNWTAGPNALSGALPWFADAVPGFRGTNCWAPDCIKVGDRYFLFYSISAFGKNTSAIGLLTSPTLDPDDPAYKWTDQGMVIKSVTTDDYNTIDPAAVLDFSGNLWLAFGSFWTGIKLIALDKSTGHRVPDSPIYAIAQNQGHATATNEGALTDPINKSQIEASYIYPHDRYYYLFVAWGLCCHGLASTYHIRVGRSQKITGPYLDKDGVDLTKDGGTLFLGDEGPMIDTSAYPRGRGGAVPAQVHALVGPGHAGIVQDGDKFWFSFHYYDGTTPNGTSVLGIRPLTWEKSGWPVLGEYPAPAPVPSSPLPQGGLRGRGGAAQQPPAAPAAVQPAATT